MYKTLIDKVICFFSPVGSVRLYPSLAATVNVTLGILTSLPVEMVS
ncbi:Uncharacterised protein [Mycoplasmopsis synoviae]|uniref:Uncharacterized protein n=1 Tax=Mycoplasmopsis synoviae TaxID=2109 RepID=A0A3B0P6U0_MYCSY|nr:Uncharacterised protein [Mycoplasmopsis synoviae]